MATIQQVLRGSHSLRPLEHISVLFSLDGSLIALSYPPTPLLSDIYSFELDLLDPLRLPNLSLISMDQAISRPHRRVNCDPRVSGKMRMSHESKYCFSAPYMPPEFTTSQRAGATDTRNDNCLVDSRVIMDGLYGSRDYITDPLCECQRLRAQ